MNLTLAHLATAAVTVRYGNANTTGEVGKGAAVTSNDGLILDGAATATGAGAGAGAGAGTGAGAGSRAVSSEEELNRQTEILRCDATYRTQHVLHTRSVPR